jgi:LacI family transcriptional regulator
MSERITIDDVAALARVSIKTVSRVINEEPNVSASTRDKVEKAITRLKFRPSRAAKSLASRKAFTIGLLYDNPCAHYVANVQTGVLDECEGRGYDLIVHPRSLPGYELAREVISLYQQARFDGVILTPPLCDNQTILAALSDEGIPTTLIAPGTPVAGFPSVITDDESASYKMTKYLVSLGHRHIAFVSGHPSHIAVQRRTLGFMRALSELGLTSTTDMIVPGFNSFGCGIEAGNKLLSQTNPPTAIFAANDEMAAGVLSVAHDRGLNVPGDLSLAGFDDIPIATQSWPPLTTIVQPIRQMAKRATSLLLDIVSGNSPSPRDVVEEIPSKLVYRQSTAKPSAVHK